MLQAVLDAIAGIVQKQETRGGLCIKTWVLKGAKLELCNCNTGEGEGEGVVVVM